MSPMARLFSGITLVTVVALATLGTCIGLIRG